MVRQFPNQAGKVNAVHFSPDGKTLVTASGISGLRGVATIWNVDTGEIIREIGGEAHRDILFDAEFSPDGTLLATAGYDRVIRIWETATGKFLRDISGHNGAVFDLAFSPDGKLIASASGDETGKVWRVDTGKRLDTLNQPTGEQFRIAFTPDGKHILGAGADNRIRMWRLVSVEKQRINPVIHSRFGHENEIAEFAPSPDGKWLATASADHSVKLWKLPALQQVKAWENQPDLVSALAFSSAKKGQFFAARMDGSTQPYSFDEATLLKKNQTGLGARLNPVQSKIPTGDMKQIAESESDKPQPVAVPANISGKIANEATPTCSGFRRKRGGMDSRSQRGQIQISARFQGRSSHCGRQTHRAGRVAGDAGFVVHLSRKRFQHIR